MTPTTQLAQRIAGLFRRKLTTPWSQKEIKAYKILISTKALYNIEDVELIERYYKAERNKGDKGIHRRDLQTFLNNFPSELDRARAWDSKKRYGQFYGCRVIERENGSATDEDYKKAGEIAKQEIEKLRQSLRLTNPTEVN